MVWDKSLVFLSNNCMATSRSIALSTKIDKEGLSLTFNTSVENSADKIDRKWKEKSVWERKKKRYYAKH